MANKKNPTSILENTLATVKTKAQDLNKEIFQASEELIEGSVATGAQWQDIMAKALKNGTTLLGKQQEMTLDTVETLIGQYKTSNKRVRQLLGMNGWSLKGAAQKAKAAAVTVKDKTVASVEELVGDVFDTKAKVATKKAQKVNKKVVQKTTATSPKAAIKTTAAIDALFKKPATSAKVATKKTGPKAKATSKVKATSAKKSATNARVKKTNTRSKKSVIATGQKDNLTLIEGIGPKIEEVLNAAGIQTFQALATTDTQVLKTILAEAGNRFKLHDPTTWGQQAELAGAGKWEVLKVWKSRLKGGKAANEISRIVVL